MNPSKSMKEIGEDGWDVEIRKLQVNRRNDKESGEIWAFQQKVEAGMRPSAEKPRCGFSG